MKTVFRMFIFSCFALFLTSYWNKGFILPSTVLELIKAGCALALLFVIVRPLMKIVFLPFNILTFGLFSFFMYVFFLHVLSSWYGLFIIHAWQFGGFHMSMITIPPMQINYVSNLVLSSFSLSSIISALDQLT